MIVEDRRLLDSKDWTVFCTADVCQQPVQLFLPCACGYAEESYIEWAETRIKVYGHSDKAIYFKSPVNLDLP